MKKLFSLGLAGATAMIVFTALALVPVASAAEFISSPDNSGNVTISSTETHHNAYVGGGSVFINSAITGDLYAGGGSITVEGAVEQDVVIAGGNITINGPVGGDVHILGGSVIINSKVGGDIVVAGGTVTLTDKGSTGGDAFVAGGQIIFDGAVGGNMKVNAGQVTVNNAVFGDVNITTNQTLTFGSKASIAGKINYKGVKPATVQDGAALSHINFEALPNTRGGRAGHALIALLTIASIIKILSIIIFGLVIMKLYPKTTNLLVQNVDKRPWHNLLLGFVGLIVVPIASVILLITLLGAYIAIIALLMWMIMLIIASLIVCIYVGAWLLKVLGSNPGLVVDWRSLSLGTVVVIVVSFVPFIGLLGFFILLLMAFGAMLTHAHGHTKEEQASGPQTPLPGATIV